MSFLASGASAQTQTSCGITTRRSETRPVPDLIPPLPPLVAPEQPSQNGGFYPTVRLPPLPGYFPMPPQGTVLPGAEIEPSDLVIMENSRRNDGLEGDARTNTERARAAARRADPDVTSVLSESEQRAHHLIPMKVIRSRRKVLVWAGRAGFKTDNDPNVMAVPTTPAAQKKLQRAGINRPVDHSGHPEWNDAADRRLEGIEEKLDDAFGKNDSPQKDRAAYDAVQDVLRDLRRHALNMRRITSIDEFGSSTI